MSESRINKGNKDLLQREKKTQTVKRKGPGVGELLKPWVSSGRFILKGFHDKKNHTTFP
jgi:hypothetical protein